MPQNPVGIAMAAFGNASSVPGENLVHRLPAGVITVDAEGLITYYNRYAAEIWRRRPGLHDPTERFCGAFRLRRLDGSILPHDQSAISTALRSGRPIHGQEMMIEREDGSQVGVLHSVDPLRDSTGAIVGAVGVFTDITERHLAMIALKQAYREAQAANDAKDRFIAILSHELRTPLMPVMTAIQMLETELDLPPAARESVTMIRRNAELASRLIDDLLDANRIRHGKLHLEQHPADMHQACRNVVESCRSELANRRLRAELQLEATRFWVMSEPARLQQILWNLMNNAMKFTSPYGQITIRSDNPDPQTIRMAISDTGSGIDASDLSRIFEPFEQGQNRLARAGGGLGLGLSICKGLITLMGGTITASSDGRGKGASFVMHLPTIDPPVEEGQTNGIIRSVPPVCGRILLVEDHADTSRVMKRYLESLGHRVVVAGCVADAIRLADANEFDLLISDLGLPDGSGCDVMRHVKPRGLKGLALSGFGQEDHIQQSLDAGFIEHVTKPIHLGRFTAVLQRVLSHPLPDRIGPDMPFEA